MKFETAESGDTREGRVLREDINHEGPADDGGELYVGTRDEIDAAKKRNKSEGRAKDLYTFIENNSEVEVSEAEYLEVVRRAEAGELTSDIQFMERKNIPQYADVEPGIYTLGRVAESGIQIYYKSGDNSLKSVLIDTRKIEQFKNDNHPNAHLSVARALSAEGFSSRGGDVELLFKTVMAGAEILSSIDRESAERKGFSL